MKARLSRLYVVAVVAAVSMLAFAGSALALPGDPPTFDTTTLTPKLNDFGTALLAGIVILIGAVLVIKVPFLIVRIAMKTVNKVFGGSRPSAA